MKKLTFTFCLVMALTITAIAQTCPQPIDLGATNITENSADLIWTSFSGLSDIEYGDCGFVPGTGTLVTGVTSPQSIAGLFDCLCYDFYVRDDCGSGIYSLWSGPKTFYTEPCAWAYAGPDHVFCDADGNTTFQPLNAAATSVAAYLWTTSGDGYFNDPTLLIPTYTPGQADITNGSAILCLRATGVTNIVEDCLTLYFGNPLIINEDILIDSAYCDGTDPYGNHIYGFSFAIDNNTEIASEIISYDSPDGSILSLQPLIVGQGQTIVDGQIICEESVLTRYDIFSINAVFRFSTSSDTCTEKIYFVIPNCSDNVCDSNRVDNGKFSNGLVAGNMNGSGNVNNWSVANGDPYAYIGEGCEDTGYIKMEGNKISGDAIMQALSPENKIEKGNWYKVSMCVKLDSSMSQVPYLNARVLAFNESLPTGNHAPPSENASIIGYTGRLYSDNWISMEFQNWYAYKDFDKIAINFFNNDSILNSTGYIDGICLRAVTDTCECDGFERDSIGNVIIPPELQEFLTHMDVTPDFTPKEDTIEMDMGYLHHIYGDSYTPEDTAFYHLPDWCCKSIGGTPYPDSIFNIADSLATLGVFISIDSIQNILQNFADSLATADSINFPMWENHFDEFGLLYPNMQLDTICFCDTTSQIDPDSNSPFDGRDIVFVHGFRPPQIIKKIINPFSKAATTKWPVNKDEFYEDLNNDGLYGYWKLDADTMWETHIDHYLPEEKGYKNRYITIAWPTTQRVPYAAHAMLTQIHDAMSNGQGVKLLDPDDPRGTNGFGHKGYVIVSHSGGSFVTNVTMATANSAIFGSTLYPIFGPGAKQVSDKAELHIAMHGAISGSNLATLTLTVFNGAIVGLVPLLGSGLGSAIAYQLSTVSLNSILVDLVPVIAQNRWMKPITNGGQYKVPTLTIAGGSPGYKFPDNNLIFKLILFRGFDDGITSLECQTGNPLPANLIAPGGYMPKLPFGYIRAVDMGVGFWRGASNYSAQFLERSYAQLLSLNAGCVPHLSPTGMVQPIWFSDTLRSPYKRYPNHYSFLMSTSDHFTGPKGTKGEKHRPPPYESKNYMYTWGNINNEEVNVITNDIVWDSNYVNTEFRYKMKEFVRGKLLFSSGDIIDIDKPFFHRRIIITIPKEDVYWWKRTYQLLDDYKTKMECDYIYEYILRSE